MKKQRNKLTILTLVLLVAAASASAERGDDSNRKSKNGKAEGTIDGVQITVEYGRPSVKDRQIWGGLVPYDRVWRTGADEASTIEFSKDVKIEGEFLAAGRYGFFTIPGAASWTLIFNGTPDQWGAFSYAEAEDALRVRVAPREAPHEEILSFSLEGERVVLRWANTEVGFSVASD
jgi:hypothetical protein